MSDSNDETLFKDLLTSYKGVILKVARSFASTEEDLGDLFQEIILQIWLALPSYRKESKLSTWIYKVSLNKAVTWGRSEKRRRDRFQPLSEIEASTERFLGFVERNQALDHLYREIHKLNEINRSLILLYLEGLNYTEMAEILGMSENNIGVRLSRIRKQLSGQMKGSSHGI